MNNNKNIIKLMLIIICLFYNNIIKISIHNLFVLKDILYEEKECIKFLFNNDILYKQAKYLK